MKIGVVAIRCSAILVTVLLAGPARAVDEIQVYNGEITAPGQWALEQHLNYVAQGRTRPEFSGALIPNRSLNGTPELAYGLADWWELGAYAPFAFDKDGTFFGQGAKVRSLFVSPHADEQAFFYGVNFEFSYSSPRFSPTRYGLETRPILGFRHGDYEFIVNPIVDLGIGPKGVGDFAPAVHLGRKMEGDWKLGVEYYMDFGRIPRFSALPQQQHDLYAVTDFKLGSLDLHLAAGSGLTSGSDRIIVTGVIGYAFPVAKLAMDGASGAGKAN